MRTLDCLGDMCPVPLIKIQNELKLLKSQECVKIVTDHSCVVSSILTQYRDNKVTLQTEEVINGIWEITITKN